MPEQYVPHRGDIVRDGDNRVGRVMAVDVPGSRGQCWLRPLEGGYEWPVPNESVEPLELAERTP